MARERQAMKFRRVRFATHALREAERREDHPRASCVASRHPSYAGSREADPALPWAGAAERTRRSAYVSVRSIHFSTVRGGVYATSMSMRADGSFDTEIIAPFSRLTNPSSIM